MSRFGSASKYIVTNAVALRRLLSPNGTDDSGCAEALENVSRFEGKPNRLKGGFRGRLQGNLQKFGY